MQFYEKKKHLPCLQNNKTLATLGCLISFLLLQNFLWQNVFLVNRVLEFFSSSNLILKINQGSEWTCQRQHLQVVDFFRHFCRLKYHPKTKKCRPRKSFNLTRFFFERGEMTSSPGLASTIFKFCFCNCQIEGETTQKSLTGFFILNCQNKRKKTSLAKDIWVLVICMF